MALVYIVLLVLSSVVWMVDSGPGDAGYVAKDPYNRSPNYIQKPDVPTPAPETCPRSCVCQNHKAYCDALSLTHMPHRLPTDLDALLLRNNLIRRVTHRHLNKLRNLKHLMLKGNRIHKVSPASLRNLRQLVSLSFTDNNLRVLEKDTFRALTELRFLSLRNNKLRNLEGLFSKLYNLQLLNAADNRIRKITSKTFRSNWRIVILDLHQNRIKHIHKHAFRAMPLIKYLVLRDNPIHTLEVNFKPNIHLELLDFTNCSLTEMVQGLPYSINDLRLSENNITRINDKDFKNTKKIRLLVLTSNNLEYIDDLAFSRMTHLYDLYIGGNSLVKIPENLPHNLHGIFANGNVLTNIQTEPLTGVHSLEFLYLRGNKIHDVQQEALWSLGNLRSLDLSNNDIGDLKSMTFRGNKHLQRLDISQNPLLQLDRDSFVGLENLHIFEMASVGSRYETSHVNPVIFKDMKRLLFLDLSNSSQVVQGIAENPNTLDYMSSIQDLNLMEDSLVALPANFPNHFPNLRMIKLIGNPWHCDMDILWLAYWMRNQTVEFFAPFHMVCASPPELRGQLIMHLTESELMPVTKRKPIIKYIEITLQEYSGSDTDEEFIDITRHPHQYNYTTGQTRPPGSDPMLTIPSINKTYTSWIFPGTENRDENADLIARYITPDRDTKTLMETFKTIAPNFMDDKNNKTKILKPKKKKNAKSGVIHGLGRIRHNYNFTKWKDKGGGILNLKDSNGKGLG